MLTIPNFSGNSQPCYSYKLYSYLKKGGDTTPPSKGYSVLTIVWYKYHLSPIIILEMTRFEAQEKKILE